MSLPQQLSIVADMTDQKLMINFELRCFIVLRTPIDEIE